MHMYLPTCNKVREVKLPSSSGSSPVNALSPLNNNKMFHHHRYIVSILCHASHKLTNQLINQ